MSTIKRWVANLKWFMALEIVLFLREQIDISDATARPVKFDSQAASPAVGLTILVNRLDGSDIEMRFDYEPTADNIALAASQAKLATPNWTSLVVTIVRD